MGCAGCRAEGGKEKRLMRGAKIEKEGDYGAEYE